MTTRRAFHLHALGALATVAIAPRAGFAQASDYPNRPVKLIVPFAAGGGPDILARKMAVKLAEVLGKGGVVVDNIVGAGGILAGQNVARMAPDGYNVLIGASSHVTQKAMQPGIRFDPLKDFTLITRIAYAPSVLVVAADSPYKSVDDIMAAAKKSPGKLNYASGGVGSAAHLSAAALVLHAQADIVHIPYKGSVEIIPSLLSGATQFALPIASTAVPLIQAGKVRALAVTSAQRMAVLPNVPSLVEIFKTPDLALDSWFGLWAPAGTPADVVDILFKAVVKTYEDPAVRAEAEATGSVVAPSRSPQEFRSFVESETLKFEKLVKAAHLSVNN